MDPVYMLDLSGRVVAVPPDQAAAAAQGGLTPATPEQVATFQAEEARRAHYDTLGQGAASFIEGAASGLTFGLSTGLEQALGVPAEDIAGRQEFNPVAHGAGTLVGVAAPLVATWGASAPASGAAAAAEGAGALAAARGAAEFTAPALIGKVGQAAAKAAGAVEVGGRLVAPEGANLLARLAPVAAQGAAEGALYAGADVTEKALLKDPNLTAESVVAELGLGALFGGALMGGGKLAGEGLAAATESAAKAVRKAAEAAAKGEKNETLRLVLSEEARPAVLVLDKAAPGAADVVAQAAYPKTARFIVDNADRVAALEAKHPGMLKTVLSKATPEEAAFILDNEAGIISGTLERNEIGRVLTDKISNTYQQTSDAVRAAWREARSAEMETLAAKADAGTVLEQAAGVFDDLAEKVAELKRAPELYTPGSGVRLERIGEGLIRDIDPVAPAAAEAAAPAASAAPATTWRDFVASKMGAYMKSEGGHGPAMRKIAAEWKALKEGAAAAAPAAEAVAEAAAPAGAAAVDVASIPSQVYKRLNRLKQSLDDLIPWGAEATTAAGRDTTALLKDLRGKVRAALEDTTVWGEAGERQAAFNEAFQRYKDAAKRIGAGKSNTLEARILRKIDDGAGGITYEANEKTVNAWLNAMADARGGRKSDAFNAFLNRAEDLAAEMGKSGYEGADALRTALRQMRADFAVTERRATVNHVINRLRNPGQILVSEGYIPTPADLAKEAGTAVLSQVPGAGLITRTATATVEKLRSPSMLVGLLGGLDKLAQKTAAAVNRGVGRIFEAEAVKGAAEAAGAAAPAPRVTRENFPHVAASLNHLGSDLDRLAETTAAETAPLADHAPATTDALHQLAARGVGLLGDKLPRGPERRPLDREFTPSDSELASLNRTLDIAHRPTRALELIARGSYTPEHHAALTTLYPKLAEAMKLEVLDRLSAEMAKGTRLPYKTRLTLSLFLGSDLDSSTSAEAIAAAQAAHAMAPAIEAAQGRGGEMKIGGDQMQTGRQAALSRLG